MPKNNVGLGLLGLIVIIITGLYFLGIIPPKPPNVQILPDLKKAVFFEAAVQERGTTIKIKSVFNNDKTWILSFDPANRGDSGSWELQLQNDEMIKVTIKSRDPFQAAKPDQITFYKNREAVLSYDDYQIPGKWYQ